MNKLSVSYHFKRFTTDLECVLLLGHGHKIFFKATNNIRMAERT